jgi:hypothetical protein
MQNIFQVKTVSYSLADDSVKAVVYLARFALDPETELTYDDTFEKFAIEVNFANRVFTIRDLDTDFQGDAEPHYAPSVMTAFLKAFDVEKDDELFRFTVEL